MARQKKKKINSFVGRSAELILIFKYTNQNMPPKKRTRAEVESEEEEKSNNSEQEETVTSSRAKRARVEKKEGTYRASYLFLPEFIL
jgi:hypothetical protein